MITIICKYGFDSSSATFWIIVLGALVIRFIMYCGCYQRTEMKTKNKTSKVALIMIPITGRCYNYGGLKGCFLSLFYHTFHLAHLVHRRTISNIEVRSRTYSISHIKIAQKHSSNSWMQFDLRDRTRCVRSKLDVRYGIRDMTCN